jgi:hypothetical protein
MGPVRTRGVGEGREELLGRVEGVGQGGGGSRAGARVARGNRGGSE